MIERFTTLAASVLLRVGEDRVTTEVLITSSVLILALLLLRGVFRKTLSRRMQYALWALVLIRLLAPVRLPAAEFSVLTSVQPVQAAVSQRLEQELDRRSVRTPSAPAAVPGQVWENTEQMPAEPSGGTADAPADSGYVIEISGWDILRWSGAGVMTVFFLAVNLGFWLRLRRRRRAYPVEGCGRKTYLVEEGLTSPCLFGLLRPAIYLTPAAVSTPERLRHVLAHEETHARHLDPLWALLRCVCLAAYWFDPLVWLAAAASRTDCELACDEGALTRLGEDERISYGQTLLRLVPVRRGPGNPLLTATTMTAGKRRLKDRITRIAQKPRQVAAAAVAAVVLAGIVSACTFTGAAARTPASVSTADAVLQNWGEPEKALSLADAAPYTPEPFVVEEITDWAGRAEVYSSSSDFGLDEPFDICLLTSAQEDMQHFAVVDKRLEHLVYRSFLALPMDREGGSIGFYGGGGFPEGLFGHAGPVNAITYQTEDGVMLTDYVCVGEDGMPSRLVQAVSGMSETFHVDCDGDGNAEVVAPNQLFFQRGDTVYAADIPALWAEAYPEHILDWSQWDAGTGMLTASGHVQGGDGVTRTWTRYLRYDGENLLVYRDPRTMEDHVMSGIRVPEEVLDKAKELVQDWMPQGGETGELDTAEYDDWRIENMTGPTEHKVGGITVHAYCFNYEYHTTTPTEVVLAGGRYITEDDWVMPGYPECDYLFFRVEEDGGLTFLWHEMSNDSGPEALVEPGLSRLGLLNGDPVYQVQSLWDALCAEETLVLDLNTADGAGGGAYSTDISWGYNRPRDITSDFRWEELDKIPDGALENTAILRVSGESNSLTFYQRPKLVEYQRDGERQWFRAEQTVTDDVFAGELFEHVRRWYDEIEADALEMGIVIPDDGRSYKELARAWIEQYEGTHLLATSGSKHRWIYLDVVSVEVVEEFPQNYPEDIGDREAFRFYYSVVFVPENQDALNWSMAGNTMNYEGEDAPENAFQWWRMGYLYLSEDGWRCDGTGTG